MLGARRTSRREPMPGAETRRGVHQADAPLHVTSEEPGTRILLVTDLHRGRDRSLVFIEIVARILESRGQMVDHRQLQTGLEGCRRRLAERDVEERLDALHLVVGLDVRIPLAIFAGGVVESDRQFSAQAFQGTVVSISFLEGQRHV